MLDRTAYTISLVLVALLLIIPVAVFSLILAVAWSLILASGILKTIIEPKPINK